MPKRTDLQTILLIGSGPIVIGQGAEFDYSGTQAVRALKEEGYRVVLVNSNPATIMVGVPARRVGWMCQCGVRLVLAGDSAPCAACGARYRETGGVLRQIDPPTPRV